MKEEKVNNKKLIRLAKKLNNKQINLILSSVKQYEIINNLLLAIALNNPHIKIIYVSLNKEYAVFSRKLRNSKIQDTNIYVIDGVSKHVNQNLKINNCMFLTNPHSLIELSLAITAAIEKGKFNFVFFDSLDTLFLYDTLNTIQQFGHYIISKIRNNELGCAIICLKHDEKAQGLIPILSQFCDSCIDLSKELE